MNPLDIILLISVIVGALLGLKSGIVRLLSFGAGIAIGLLQASIFYNKAAAWLQEVTELDSLVCLILGFVIVFIIVAAIVNIAGAIMRGVLKVVLLGWLDRALGAAFAAILAIGVVVLGVNISESAAPENEITSKTSQEESLLYKKCAEVTFLVIEEAKKIDEEKEQHTEETCEQGL
ncbi:MAG: CvpA family protein [Bacteroidaceae bacterium]|nr:CvpA family protein [Bacteroidaceae bacterium]